MAADRHRRVAQQLLAAHALDGEELLGAAPAWVARVGPKGHVFFVGRHRHLVALTDRRVITWRHPKRATTPSLDLALAALELRGERPTRPFFQVSARADTDRGTETILLELRHRDHAFARALGRAIAGTTTSAV